MEVELQRFKNLPVRPLRVDEYLRLAKQHAFDDERVELLDGVVVKMSPIGRRHGGVHARLLRLLVLACEGKGVVVYPQSSLRMSEYSMPEPDVCVAPDHGKFVDITDSLLVVEVADSSVRRDRTIKTPIYATGGVPEYWIVHVRRQQVEVLTKPAGDRYRTREIVGRGGVLRPALIPGVAIAVDDLFRASSTRSARRRSTRGRARTPRSRRTR